AFFFQAEDGIRDFHVTGVQTCALPISARSRPASTASHIPMREREIRHIPTSRSCSRPMASPISSRMAGRSRSDRATVLPMMSRRSEERRVGKEGRKLERQPLAVYEEL